MTFNLKLRELRREAGYTLEEAGEKVGVSGVTIGNWERGSREPSIRQIENLAKLYGVQEGELFRDSQEEPEIIDLKIYECRMKETFAGQSENEELEELIDIAKDMEKEKIKALIGVAYAIKNN